MFCILSFACKSDEVLINNDPSEGSYSWTTSSITYAAAYDVQIIDRNNYFLSTTTGLYKVTNNVPSLFTVNNSVFKAEAGYVYDDTYIVYKGRKVSDNKPQFMIFNNGTYTIYNLPDTNLSEPYFESRGKFYCTRTNYTPNYYRFENEVFTLFSFDAEFGQLIGKVNGQMYLFAFVSSSFTRKIYRITDGGPMFIREEPANGWIYPLNNAVINSGYPVESFSYFSESGWINLFNVPSLLIYVPPVVVGENANSFTLVRQDTSFTINAGRWNGVNYKRFTNIPPEINFKNSYSHLSSRFRDNTFYILVRGTFENPKVIKGIYTE